MLGSRLRQSILLMEDGGAVLSRGGTTMRKMCLTTSSVLVGMLCAITVALAGDPGTEDPNNWPQYHRTAHAWRYSPLDQINTENVGKLSVAWIAHGGDITMGIQETPLAIDGVIYSITSGDRVARWMESQDRRSGGSNPNSMRSRRRCCSRRIAVASRSATAWSSLAQWMDGA
jgi:glucose dehydrogenase